MTKVLSSVVLVCVAVLVGRTLGAEWFTSKTHHCIDKCSKGEREGREVYSCFTVDGVQKEFVQSGSGSRPGFNDQASTNPEDKIPWDYCSPAPISSLEHEDPISNEAAPIANETNSGQGGSGGSGFNPGNSVPIPTSLPGVDCTGPCSKSNARFMCNIDATDGMNRFYCSPRLDLERKQISSQNKLWCTETCIKNENQDHFMCKTLLGMDHCSPKKGFSSKMTECLGPCMVQPGISDHLHCQVDEVNDTWETCGDWEIDHQKTSAIEYTVDDKVCASPCNNVDGEMVCSYVEWETETTEAFVRAFLSLKVGECGARDSGTDWVLIGIILGCVVGALIIVGVTVGLVTKKKYHAAPTNP